MFANVGVQKVKHGLGGTDESLPAANMYSQDDLTKLELQGHFIKKKKKINMDCLAWKTLLWKSSQLPGILQYF